MHTVLKNFRYHFLYLAMSLLLLVLVSSEARAQIFKIPHPDTTAGNAFGSSVAIDGDRAIVGASAENICGPNSGAAYVFERDSTEGIWLQAARLTPKDCIMKFLELPITEN